MEMSEFGDKIKDLGNLVDWNVMGGRYWGDTADDPDRKRRRQAEFLVHQDYPLAAFHEIGVYDKAVAKKVKQLLPATSPGPNVTTRVDWYY